MGLFSAVFQRTELFRRDHPGFYALIIGIGLCINMLILMEVACSVLVLFRSGPQTRFHYSSDHSGPYGTRDDILGYRAPSENKFSVRREDSGLPVYDVIYSFDDRSRRKTPVRDIKDRDEYVLFFGGSFTFGEGLNDDETIPYYFCESYVKAIPYNYAFHGYGPQSMLAKLQSSEMKEEIKEKRGMLFYIYVADGHEERAIGRMSIHNAWGKNLPYYHRLKDGSLVRRGTLLTGRPILSKIYNILGKSAIVRFFKIDFPLRLSPGHYNITAEIIKQSQEVFSGLGTSGEFYVVIYPVKGKKVRIIPYLETAHIKYIDFSALFDPTSEEFCIQGDGHPSAAANSVLGKALAEKISSSGYR